MTYTIFLVVMRQILMCTSQCPSLREICPLSVVSEIHNGQCDLSAVKYVYMSINMHGGFYTHTEDSGISKTSIKVN